MALMLNKDIDEHFSNAEFRNMIDPNFNGNMLEDLTHQFIHRAIETGSKEYQARQKDRE